MSICLKYIVSYCMLLYLFVFIKSEINEYETRFTICNIIHVYFT